MGNVGASQLPKNPNSANNEVKNEKELEDVQDGKEKPHESPKMLKQNQDKEIGATGIESFKKDKQKKERVGKSCEHPQRPDGHNCKFYMETGTCKFGSNCKFNHPPIRKKNDVKIKKVSKVMLDDKEKSQESPKMLKHYQNKEKQATMEDSPRRPCPKVMHSTNDIPGFAGNTACCAVNNYGIESFTKDNQEKEKVGNCCEHPQGPDEPNCNFYMGTGTWIKLQV